MEWHTRRFVYKSCFSSTREVSGCRGVLVEAVTGEAGLIDNQQRKYVFQIWSYFRSYPADQASMEWNTRPGGYIVSLNSSRWVRSCGVTGVRED